MARNQENGNGSNVNLQYSNEDVCRPFLCGLCPRELFFQTKFRIGPCRKVHSLQLRKEYEVAKRNGVVNYNEELEHVILKVISKCHLYTSRFLEILTTNDASAATTISVTEVTQTPEVMELAKQIKNKLKEADEFDLEGKTDLKIRALEEVEELRTKRADKEAMLLFDAFCKVRASQVFTQELELEETEDHDELGTNDDALKALEEVEALNKEPVDDLVGCERLRICDICGAFLDINYSDCRLEDHFLEKIHLGCMQIREKLAELQE